MDKRIPILIGLFLLILSVWVQISSIGTLENYIKRLENIAYDVQLRTKIFTHPKPFKTSVAIVDIDDKSLNKEGRWPWSRAKLAVLLAKIQAAGAVVITMDMLFPEKETNVASEIIQTLNQKKVLPPQFQDELLKIEPLFDSDARFATILKQSDTEMGMSFLMRASTANQLRQPLIALTQPEEKQLEFITALGYISNIPVIQNAVKTVGFVNVYADDDGIIRSVPLLIRYKDGLYPSLALEAVRLFLLSDVKLMTAIYRDKLRLEGVNVGNHLIPTDSKARVIVPFRGRSFTFPFYSATDVLNNKIPPDVLLGKIVFVGTSATGLGDLPATSIESAFPGVEIQATIADGILNNTFSYKPAWGQGAEIFLTIALGLILVFVFPYLGPRLITLMIFFIPTALVFFNNLLWEKTGIIIVIFIPVILTLVLALLNMIYGYLFETRRREHLKEMFGQYVPAKHIDEMLTTAQGSYGLYGEDREMTVLFADIRNFTTISEKFSATQLKEMLNDFFTPMTEIIFKHRGTIDKYVGDLIMAFWGAPLKDKRHAVHSMLAALDMQFKLSRMQSLLREQGWPEIQVGIGINSGVMSVGDMGSKFRRNYTVLGDAVNLASRVESLTKFYGVKIIVTEFTRAHHKGFVFRELDRVRVKGKEKSVILFELICKAGEQIPERITEHKIYIVALNHYYKQEWVQARTLFTEIAESAPQVKLYRMYLDRITQFEKNPPAADWDGVYTLTEK